MSRPTVHTYDPANGRPMLPQCCACGCDVLACVERLGYACHLSTEQTINRRRLNRWRHECRAWYRTANGRAFANRAA